MSDTPGAFSVPVPGPFTLRVTFCLTKNGREEVGNLFGEQAREFSKQFETLPEVFEWLKQQHGYLS